MSIERYERRLSRLEGSLAGLTPDTWTHEELINAMKAGTATPMQMDQVWSVAKEDIRTQIIRVARNRWLFYQGGGQNEWDVTFPPVSRALETLSYPADVPLVMKRQWVPPYDPEAWADPLEARRTHRHIPDGFRRWSRTYLMKRLLGEDGGLGLRREIGRWIDGGDPPIDEDHFPDASIYNLILPIDGDPSLMFDARMLRLPTVDLWWKIDHYPSFDPPPDDWVPVDISGFERI